MTDLDIIANLNPGEFAVKSKEIYEGVKDYLEKKHKGEFVAIEPDSGDYFLGSEPMKAINKGKKKHPNKIFYLIKIGFPAVTKMSSYYRPFSYGSIL